MAQMPVSNPTSNLMFDWLTVLQNKAEGLSAYEKYIRDAEKVQATECVEMLRRLHEEDARMVQEIKEHVFGMIRKQQAGPSRQ
jgi:hypothetical protein